MENRSAKNSLIALGPGWAAGIYTDSVREKLDQLLGAAPVFQDPKSIFEDPDRLREVDILFSGWGSPKLDQRLLSAAPNLKAVFYAGGSLDGLLSQEFKASGIRTFSTIQLNSEFVADYTTSLIYLSLKGFWNLTDQIRANRRFPDAAQAQVPGLRRAKVGLVSLGRIGIATAQQLKRWNIELSAYDPYFSAQEAKRLGIRLTTLETLFAESEIVSIHTPLKEETRHLIKSNHLARMPAKAVLINTARGPVIDEKGLVEVFNKRPDLKAILDVTDPEPFVPDSPVSKLENVCITPHIAGILGRDLECFGAAIADELERFLKE
ncbi:MAG: hydroxyacid dehydrogenase [Opitutales bacterium]|nr:hydroxyacid dehydrogenase [Opitutales bacterium]